MMTVLFIAGAVGLTAITFYKAGYSNGEADGYMDALLDIHGRVQK